MAHIRYRFLNPYIKDALSFSPLVGIVGQRQVGKTTLMEEIVGENYVSFDDELTLEQANQSTRSFLESFKTLAGLDECQLLPKIFPALKLLVQKNKRPAQFILTGSIRFTSRKLIEESLTGRIHNLELLPLCLAEINKIPIGDFTKWANYSAAELERQVTHQVNLIKYNSYEKFLDQGGLPGICFLRKKQHRNSKFRSHLETLLRRDIQLIIQTTVPYQNLIALLRYLALHQGHPIHLSEAGREAQISPPTIKKIIDAFENMFLIRRVTGIDFVKSPSFYFEDQGLATFLTPVTPAKDVLRFAFSQLLAQAHYNHMNEYSVHHYNTKAGADLPLVFKIKNRYFGFDVSLTPTPSLPSVRSAHSFLAKYPNSIVCILTSSKNTEKMSPRLLCVPLLAVV